MSKKKSPAKAFGQSRQTPKDYVPPYQPLKVKTTNSCFVAAEELQEKNICLFKGKFWDVENKRVQIV